MKEWIQEICKPYSYLFESKILLDHDKQSLQQYLNAEISDDQILNCLPFLSELLYMHHSKKVFILIDEFDR